MPLDLINIPLAFIEGLALIASPCILPILPIILAGSLTGSKKRPIGIIIGFILIFSLFTFFSRQLVAYTHIDTNLIRTISYEILLLLGVIMMSSYLTEKFSLFTQGLINIGSGSRAINDSQGGLFSGILFGSLIALIWTPCAGPILAAVIVQIVLQQSNLSSLFILISFGLGAAIPMLVIALIGRKILEKLNFLQSHASFLRKLLGLIIILVVADMIYAEFNTSSASVISSSSSTPEHLTDALSEAYPAPAIAGIDAWINSPPLELNQLKGKVVLIDFWTYSCINCIRTLPYLLNWYDKYHDKGLVIIGVHAPEFDFEKDLDNVKNAVAKYGIKYPVALDNHFVTWRNYHNQYWPAHYLINKNGEVVYTHFGEGDYDVTENNIRYLLDVKSPSTVATANEQTFSYFETPETYLGYLRADRFSSNEMVSKDQSANYSFPSQLSRNAWALQGQWKITSNYVLATQANAAIEIKFHARHVYMVAGSETGLPAYIKVILDGKVLHENMLINKHSLYELTSLNTSQDAILQVIANNAGLEVYTFTFGE